MFLLSECICGLEKMYVAYVPVCMYTYTTGPSSLSAFQAVNESATESSTSVCAFVCAQIWMSVCACVFVCAWRERRTGRRIKQLKEGAS